jgi:hypothetical protein
MDADSSSFLPQWLLEEIDLGKGLATFACGCAHLNDALFLGYNILDH